MSDSLRSPSAIRSRRERARCRHAPMRARARIQHRRADAGAVQKCENCSISHAARLRFRRAMFGVAATGRLRPRDFAVSPGGGGLDVQACCFWQAWKPECHPFHQLQRRHASRAKVPFTSQQTD